MKVLKMMGPRCSCRGQLGLVGCQGAVLLVAIFVAACARVPKAPSLPATSEILDAATTRQLVAHWVGNAYPREVAERPIRLVDQHRELPTISGLTPAKFFSKDDQNPAHLGTLVMAHASEDRSPLAITENAWQFTSQPATVVAQSQKDGSLELTALDFRAQKKFAERPLASNFRLPFDYVEKQEANPVANFLALIDPVGWSDRRGFYLATAYDPDKIPLIFIHGLLSTPLDFAKLSSRIASEPDLWKRYQFWYYFYPTGDPWVVTAANFRQDFRRLTKALDPEGDDRPLRKKTTIIAHSMGGLISRLSLSENPEKLYQQYFNQPLEETRLPAYQKKRIREQLLFEPLNEPSKVIFLATPHRGAGLASGPLTWLTRKLVRAPAEILGFTLNTAQMMAFAEPGLLTPPGVSLLSGNEVSVSEMRPDSPSLQALNSMPVRAGVELHNIVASVTGSENRIGDGVVPFTSASLDEATSQSVVRSGHWLIYDPETADLVITILRKK